MMLSPKIPFAASSPRYEPLSECVRGVARKTGYSEYVVATMMSRFLEEVCEQVARNRVVNVPGFGVFAPVTWKSRRPGASRSHSVPRFSASRGFRNAVRTQCPPDFKYNHYIQRHGQRHHLSNRPQRGAARPMTTFKAFRERLAAQAARAGMPTTNDLACISIPRGRHRRPPPVELFGT